MSVKKAVIFAVALLVVVSVGATAESINWTVSGGAIGEIALDSPDDCSMLLINVQARGSQGTANIFGLNRRCPDPADGENTLVVTFRDGSILNAVINRRRPATFDFDPATGIMTVTFHVKFKGGVGRFANAKGRATATLNAAPVAPGSSVQYEWGTFTGRVRY